MLYNLQLMMVIFLGGGNGIGASIVQRMLDEGCERVFVVDISFPKANGIQHARSIHIPVGPSYPRQQQLIQRKSDSILSAYLLSR